NCLGPVGTKTECLFDRRGTGRHVHRPTAHADRGGPSRAGGNHDPAPPGLSAICPRGGRGRSANTDRFRHPWTAGPPGRRPRSGGPGAVTGSIGCAATGPKWVTEHRLNWIVFL